MVATNPNSVKPEVGAVLREANHLVSIRRHSDALGLLLEALQQHPDHAALLGSAANLAERLERFDVSWSLLERSADAHGEGRTLAYPRWNGAPQLDKTLLVWRKQRHIGAVLRNAAMLKDALPLFASVVVECDSRLASILERSFPGIRCIEPTPDDKPLGSRTDVVHASYEVLGAVFRSSPRRFPRHHGYLSASPERVAILRRQYRSFGSSPIVGISWGSTNEEKDVPQTLDWLPILQTPGVRFVSLQYGDVAPQLQRFRAAGAPEIMQNPEIDPLKDMEGSLAQIAAIDLVVSISNTTVHTAGALGVPTWVLVDTRPMLIWPVEKTKTSFYPSVTVVRKPDNETWDAVMNRLAVHLRRYLWLWRASDKLRLPSVLRARLLQQIRPC